MAKRDKKSLKDKAASRLKKSKTKSAEQVIDISMDEFSLSNYKAYGEAVLEDRAIPDFRDGLNPVNRRVLWSAYDLNIRSTSKFVKAARIVGDVLGRFHPHGDSACYSAMVGMTNVGSVINNACFPYIEGEGNWGNLSDRSAAAMRYTEARLSAFSDAILFNKFYMPVVQHVPNFDSSSTEPLVLPALLPVLFLNGRFGIAPGATANIPAFDGKTLLEVLKKAYSGEAITSSMLSKTLRAVTTFGGTEVVEKSEGRKALFSDRKGSTLLQSNLILDEKKRTITIDRFAQEKIVTLLEKLPNIEDVQTVRDMSDTGDKYGRVVVQLKRGKSDLKAVAAKVRIALTIRENYVLNFTRRYKDDTGQCAATMEAMTLPRVLTRWIKWRTALERKACKYWIKQDDKELHRLALLVQAVDLIDLIVKLLKDKKLKSNDEVFAAYAEVAKVEIEDAKYVLSRPIISLRNLEKTQLNEKIKEVKVNRAALKARHDAPEKFMLEQLKEFAPFFKG